MPASPYEYILRDIRAGLTLPDRWPEDELEEEEEAEPEYRRWWEEEEAECAPGGKGERNGR